MAIAVDIIILAIMGICIFIGYQKGLLGVAVNILGFFIALIIALVLYTPISNFIINNTEIKPTLQNAISDTVASYIIKEDESKQTEKIEDNSSKVMSDYINEFVEEQRQNMENTEREIINNVSGTVAINIIRVAVGILVFIIAKIALLFVKVLADIITKIPVIGDIDKVGGVVYGALQGLIIIFIVLAIISLFAPAAADSAIIEAINTSYVGKILYNNNIILKIIF